MGYFRCCVIYFLLNNALHAFSEEDASKKAESSMLQKINEWCSRHPETLRLGVDATILAVGCSLGGAKVMYDIIRTPNDKQLIKLLRRYPESAKCGAILVGGVCVSMLLSVGKQCHNVVEQCTNITGIDDDGDL